MKAIVQEKYGSIDNLELREIEKPVPGDDEVLVKVRSASVHPDVWHVIMGRPYILRLMGAGVFKPKQPVPGTDMAGVVEAAGSGVTAFKAGDEVFGETIGKMQWVHGGAWAEYVVVKQDSLALKPACVSFEQAASVPTAGYITLMNLRSAEPVGPGQKVLVNGAGGGVGSIALQVLKARGALVTAVDNGEKQKLLKQLGADRFMDYTVENYTLSGDMYDLVFDIPGNYSFSECRRVLKPEGTYIHIGYENFGKTGQPVLGLIPHFFSEMFKAPFYKQLPRPIFTMPQKKEIISKLKDLLETEKLTPVIGRSFPLEKAAEAVRCLEDGNSMGRIVVTV